MHPPERVVGRGRALAVAVAGDGPVGQPDDGQVVGVNTVIATVSGRSSGSIEIGFAVPIDRAVDVAEDIIGG